MMSALKITLLRIADRGEARCMTLSTPSWGYVARNMAGTIAKYLATSLAIEKVVSEPRVIRSCFPISTISMSLVGLESRSTMLPGFARGLGAGVHRHADVRLRQRGGVVGAVTRHRDQAPAALLLPDQLQLLLRRRLREEIVHAGFRRDGGGGQRVVARDHHRPDPHGAKPVEALLHAALHHVLQVDHAQHLDAPLVALRDDQRRAALAGDGVHHLTRLRRDRAARLCDPAPR